MIAAVAGSARRRKPRALYVSPHQDDEQITYGAAILADAAAGFDVAVLLATDGRNAGSRTSPTMNTRLGYTPTPEQYAVARDREFVESCLRMGAEPIVPPIEARAVDGSATPEGVEVLVREYCAPGAVLRGTSQNDYHADHRAVGDALIALEADDFGSDLRLMFASYSVHTLELGPPSGTTLHTIDNLPFPLHYQWPYRHVDVPEGWWGIGYLDVPYHFDIITSTDPDTYWHRSPAA